MASTRGHISAVLDTIQDSITRLDNLQDPDDASSLVVRLQYLCMEIINRGEIPDSIVRDISFVINSLEVQVSDSQDGWYGVPVVKSNQQGRPSFDIRKEQLEYLIETNFTVPQISALLGVSKRTIERRLAAYGIRISGRYSSYKV